MGKLSLIYCARLTKTPIATRRANNPKKLMPSLIQPSATLLFFWLLVSAIPVTIAQSLPAGLQEYYVLGRESQVFDFCNYIGDGEGFSMPVDAMVSVVTVTGTMDGQTIIYDHWEDGYETDPFHPIQTTTETHTLNHGQVITFASDGSAGGVNAVIPIPRGSLVRYDGGDRIISLGGPVNLAHAMWPETVWLIADAWEVYPRQALTGFYTYRVPVGQDSYNGNNGTFSPFKYVVLQVSAYEDNTQVMINNGPDQISFTLNRGQTYSTLGNIDETSATAITVRANSLVSADKDIQVGILTGSDGSYQTRFYNMIPLKAYGRDYIVPVRGSNSAPVNIYLFNPNSVATTVRLYPGGNTYSIAANSSQSWIDLTGSALTNGSGARILSDQLIWGVVAYDYTNTSRDWGFSLIPTRYLRNEYYVSWSPVDNNPGPARSGGGNPVWITPLQDNTIVHIDLNGDNVYDRVDTDGDGVANNGTATGDIYGYPLNVLQVLRVYDQTDGRNDGTHIVASGPVAVSYGQDDICSTAGNSLDLGYAVLPLTQDFLSPIATVTATPSTTTVPTGGGDVIVTLKIKAGNYDEITGVNGWLNTNSASVSYVASSAVVTAPGFSGNIEPTIAGTLLTWNLNYILNHNEEITIQFTLRWPAGAPNQAYSLQGGADATYLIQTFHPHDDFQVVKTYLELTKQVNVSSGSAGDTLTYTITAHNSSGTSTVTNLVVSDSISEGLNFVSADNGGTFSQQTRTVIWNTLANLGPGATTVLHLNALVQVLPEVTDIHNQALATATGLPTVYSNTVTTTVIFPVINIIKSASTTSVEVDDEITFQLVIENQSSVNAINVVILDQIPVNTTYVSSSLTVSGISPTGVSDSGGISVRFATFPASGSATVTFKVTVDSDAPPGFHITNLATSESTSTLLRSSNIVSISVFRYCTNGSQCPTTYCVDGVCCDTACGGGSTTDCLVCSVAAGAPTNGTCSPLTGNSCNDGSLCTQTDTCQAGTCTGTNPVVCTPPDQCHQGVCNPATGLCSNPNQPDGTSCNDGSLCTQTDTCQAGICTGSNPVVCTALDQCHDVGVCNTGTGICSNPNKTDGTGCNDGDACTQTDTCQSGICTGTNPVVCTASDQCHQAGTCDTILGCSNPSQPNGTGCNDGDGCTQNDTCQSGVCVAGNPITCEAQDECHNPGSCSSPSGTCSNPAKPDDTPCNGGLGVCIVGVCQCLDRDHDGICDAFDICPDDPTNTCHSCPDADNDGICDVVDPCPNDPTNTCQACTDTDHDGICDSVDPCPTDPTNMCSTCGDTSDPDHDGKPNCVDPCPNDPFDSCIPCNDRDHDGICDAFDICPDDPLNLCQGCTDSDGDGICDVVDPCPTDPTNTCHACTDTDQDGLCDSVDPCPTDPTNTCIACRDTSDPDNDGEPNCVDPCPNDPFDSCIPCNDRDHDGICDAFDICPDDPTNTCHTCPDADNDGICDAADPCPNDPTNTCHACTDTDQDELCDNVDPCPTDPTNTCSACRDPADPDGDGLPNCVDPCPNDPTNTCIPCPDRDHDGICDSRDICPDDPQNKCASCPDRDNDGICDALDPCPDNPDPTCTCTDTDGDGICDAADPCPNDPTNTCGACRDTADPDKDRLPNCVDPCPNDPTNTCMNIQVAGGGCGCGTAPMEFGGLLPLLLGLFFLRRYHHLASQSEANHSPQ